jgi:hypothetical protein
VSLSDGLMIMSAMMLAFVAGFIAGLFAEDHSHKAAEQAKNQVHGG